MLTPLLIAAAAAATSAPEPLGVFGQWGAFQRKGPTRCYAIAEPHARPRPQGWKSFASVAYWPGEGRRGQVHFRLGRMKREGSAVLLRIDGRTFQLIGGGKDAWAPGPGADAAIVAAMRSGVDMTIETRTATGAVLRESYRLKGAATAVDAAAIACAR